MNDFGALAIAQPVCAHRGECGRPVAHVGDVCERCEQALRADLDAWEARVLIWHRFELAGRTLLYARPERMAELVEALEQEVATDGD